MATHEKVDVAIVGAGASGSVYAAVMAAFAAAALIMRRSEVAGSSRA